MLLATKVNSEQHEKDFGLISRLNRGGLWFITDDMRKIMHMAENYFQKHAEKLQKHSIDFKIICKDIIKDETVKCKWGEICCQSELEIEKHVSNDLLSSIINLYVRIRSFTYAKDIVQKFKLNQSSTGKDKSLRKNIKRSSDNQQNVTDT